MRLCYFHGRDNFHFLESIGGFFFVALDTVDAE